MLYQHEYTRKIKILFEGIYLNYNAESIFIIKIKCIIFIWILNKIKNNFIPNIIHKELNAGL